MHKRRLHSLRVQVLLWTILPLIIVLLILSLTGIGGHQQSMRQLVAEEHARFVVVAAGAIAVRLDHYAAHLQTLAALGATDAGAIAQRDGDRFPAMEVWLVASNQAQAGVPAAPDWVARALASLPMGQPTAVPWISVDMASGRVVWVMTLPTDQGWLVGSVPRSALGLALLVDPAQGDTTTTIALIDERKQIVDGYGKLPAANQVDQWVGVNEALASERGVRFASGGNGEDVVGYAPIAGLPWALVIREPLDPLLAPFFNLEQALPLILVAAASVSFLTLYFGLKRVVRPLRALAVQANRIGQGDFDAAAQPVGGVDEIEELRVALHIMAHRIQNDQAALQDYLRAITSAQEEERSRLARELHDETVQTLIALDHKAQMVQRTLDKNPERAREQVSDLRVLISGASQEVRRLSQALRPLYLEEVGLAPALELLAREARAEFRLTGTQRRLGADRELALFRIAQESLNNARRHAQASTIRLALAFGPDAVTVGVGDNGAGFDLPVKLTELTQHGHFGLMGVKERVQLVGGRLTLDAQRGHGTIVIVDAPYAADLSAPANDDTVAAVRVWLAG